MRIQIDHIAHIAMAVVVSNGDDIILVVFAARSEI